jgi:poly [ADP-ribose] polymerase 1
MPHKVEPAPTGRATCRGCKQAIAKGALRFAEEFQSPYSEEGGTSFRYWHVSCAAKKLANEVGEALARFDGPIDDRESIDAVLRENVRPETPYAERAGSGRARCRGCNTPIKKDELRVAFERMFDSPMGPQKGAAYAHPRCVSRYLEREAEHGREAPDRDDTALKVLANSKLSEEDLDIVRRDITTAGS